MTDLRIAISYLPVWKAGATGEERLQELLMIAQKHPEQFAHMVVIYQQVLPDGDTQTRYISNDMKTTALIGLLELGKLEVLRWAGKF